MLVLDWSSDWLSSDCPIFFLLFYSFPAGDRFWWPIYFSILLHIVTWMNWDPPVSKFSVFPLFFSLPFLFSFFPSYLFFLLHSYILSFSGFVLNLSPPLHWCTGLINNFEISGGGGFLFSWNWWILWQLGHHNFQEGGKTITRGGVKGLTIPYSVFMLTL